MRKARFTDEQMVAILREADREAPAVVAKRHKVSEQTIYNWRKKFGALGTDEVRRLKQLETENGRLKKLVAERDLEIGVMKEIAAKNGARAGPSRRGGVCDDPRRIVTPRLHADGCSAICAWLLLAPGGEGRACDSADGRAVVAVSALRLSADRDLPAPRRA